MQNKILRILQFKNIRTNINKLYKDFGILKLKDLRKFNTCCIVERTYWNRLPNDLKENMSGSQFKNKLKLHFLNNY